MLGFSGIIDIPKQTYKLMDYCDKYITIIESIYLELLQNHDVEITIQDRELITQLKKASSNQEKCKILEEKELLKNYYIKRTFLGLLQDFCNYMSESMAMVKRFKPQIGFTLARKPLIDDMYYMSKLLVNPSETICEILYNTATQKDINKKLDSSVAKATEQYIGEGFGDLFHKIRYSNEFKSVKASCDLASHIVTNNSIIRTKKGGLNFIYLDTEDIREYSIFYCRLFSVTLMLSTRIILKLYERIFGTPFGNYDIDTLANKFFSTFDNFSSQSGKGTKA